MLVPTESSDAIVEATGTKDPELAQRLINQVYETLWLPAELSDEERLQHIQAAIAALRGIKPQDEVEGMLATQMVATHAAAMECLRRSMIQGSSQECMHDLCGRSVSWCRPTGNGQACSMLRKADFLSVCEQIGLRA